MTVFLYRHYDGKEALLYIGITSQYGSRMSHHKRYSDWYENVAKTVIEYFDTREAAQQREKELIRQLKPLHNKSKGECPQYVSQPGLEKAIEIAGGMRPLARLLNIHSAHIWYWKKNHVPAERVHSICEAVNHEVVPADLRPDLFRDRAA